MTRDVVDEHPEAAWRALWGTAYFRSVFQNESDTPNLYSEPLDWMRTRACDAAYPSDAPRSLMLHVTNVYAGGRPRVLDTQDCADFLVDMDATPADNANAFWRSITETFPHYHPERIKRARGTLVVVYGMYWDDRARLHQYFKLDRGV